MILPSYQEQCIKISSQHKTPQPDDKHLSGVNLDTSTISAEKRHTHTSHMFFGSSTIVRNSRMTRRNPIGKSSTSFWLTPWTTGMPAFKTQQKKFVNQISAAFGYTIYVTVRRNRLEQFIPCLREQNCRVQLSHLKMIDGNPCQSLFAITQKHISPAFKART